MSNSLIYLDGINSINVSKTTNRDEGLFLGGGLMPAIPNQQSQITISVDKSFLQHDPIYTLTGNSKIDHFYFYDGIRFLALKDLYLNSMQASFTIGDLPKISFSLSSYNGYFVEIASLNTGSAIKYEKIIPRLNSIYIDLINSSSTSNIKNNIDIYSIDYSVNINRVPQYSIGDYNEVEVIQMLPLQISSTISAKQKDFGSENYLLNPFAIRDNQFSYYDFDIKVSGSENSITKFPIRKTILKTSERSSNSQGYLDVKYGFDGIIGGYYAD
jgi:hypothetical protein